MKIKTNTIEEITNDTIAVVYNLENHTAVKPDETKSYDFSKHNDYLVVCGRSEWRIEKGIIKNTFCSRNHPYYNQIKLN